MASSATAYGAWPDNPIPIHEDRRLKAREHFQYAADKTAIEASIKALAGELPDVAVSWTRPVILGGKGVDNDLSRSLLNMPIILLPDGVDVPQQFTHVDDCVAATWAILRHDACSPFNIGPNDCLPLTKLAQLTNRRVFKVPFGTFKFATTIGWALRLPACDFPPSLHDFIRHPWVVAPTRLQKELGFQFRYSSEQTLLEMWAEHRRKKGKMENEGGLSN